MIKEYVGTWLRRLGAMAIAIALSILTFFLYIESYLPTNFDYVMIIVIIILFMTGISIFFASLSSKMTSSFICKLSKKDIEEYKDGDYRIMKLPIFGTYLLDYCDAKIWADRYSILKIK